MRQTQRRDETQTRDLKQTAAQRDAIARLQRTLQMTIDVLHDDVSDFVLRRTLTIATERIAETIATLERKRDERAQQQQIATAADRMFDDAAAAQRAAFAQDDADSDALRRLTLNAQKRAALRSAAETLINARLHLLDSQDATNYQTTIDACALLRQKRAIVLSEIVAEQRAAR